MVYNRALSFKKSDTNVQACQNRKPEILNETTIYHTTHIQSYLHDTFTLIKGSSIRSRYSCTGSVWVAEKLWLPTQKIIKLKDDSIIFKARVDGLKEIKRWVLGFGRLAKVRKPAELITRIKEEIEGIKQIY